MADTTDVFEVRDLGSCIWPMATENVPGNTDSKTQELWGCVGATVKIVSECEIFSIDVYRVFA